jgi:hypothetical protein
MRTIISLLSISLFVILLAEAETPSSPHRAVRLLHEPYGALRILDYGARLGKTTYLSSPITRVVRDSINYFDPDSNKFIYAANEFFNYNERGQILSRAAYKLHKEYINFPFVDTMTNIFTRDNAGDVTTQTVLFDRYACEVHGKQCIKEQFNPPVNDSVVFNCGNFGALNGYNFTCEMMNVYLYITSINWQIFDLASSTWGRLNRDTVISKTNNTVVVLKQQWDSVGNEFKTQAIFSLVFSGPQCIKTTDISFADIESDSIKTVWSGKYNAKGYEDEETVEESQWDDSLSRWLTSNNHKVIKNYNNHDDIVMVTEQDIAGNCALTNSCQHWDYGYSYDSAGLISTRNDSIFEFSNYWKKLSHFFSYRTFPASIFPNQSIKKGKNERIIINSNGSITTTSPEVICLYTISGKFIASINLNRSEYLWTLCRNQNIHVGKGLFIVKIPRTDAYFRVWRE